MKEVTAISISPDETYVAMTDNSNNHNLWIFDVETGKQVKQDKCSTDRAYQIARSQNVGDNIVATAGVKHFRVWDLDAQAFKRKKGLYSDTEKPTSHCCVTWGDNGNIYSGDANSHIYQWDGRDLKNTYDNHGTGFMCAFR